MTEHASEQRFIILAAGQGTRMRSSLPKVLHNIAGVPMLEHTLNTARACAPEADITVVFRPGMEETAQRYQDRAAPAYQTEQLGTAHAVQAGAEACPANDGVTVIMYADTPLIRPETLNALIQSIKDGASVCVAGFAPEDPAKYGRLVTGDNGELQRIVEYNDASESERAIRLCNSGIMAVNTAVLNRELPRIDNRNAKGEYYLTDLIALVRAAGGKAAYITAGEEEFTGVNTRTELARAEAIFQNRMRRRFTDSGVTLIAPETVFFHADTEIEPDALIEPHVVFGAGAKVKTGAVIRAFSYIEGASVGEHCAVGPYARLRPGTELAASVKIGNFVEVKNSAVSTGAKINHLTYIGDADIGAQVNIGAGCVTCNYDGKQKSRTSIGDGAFIGSNCAMVAPVHIGAGAVLAAGSAVTENVPDNALAIARSRQTHKENYHTEKNGGDGEAA